jgi:hypothetical protein
MHPEYIETTKEKDFFNDSKTILYTPDNWDTEEHNGQEGVTGKHILDVCDGNYALADIVYSLCDWQHPSTVLDELKREEEEENIPGEFFQKVEPYLNGELEDDLFKGKTAESEANAEIKLK